MRKPNYARTIKTVPQNIRSRPDEVQNSAGGYVFQVNKWDQLRRFLIMGTEGGTFYIQEKELTIENANAVLSCIKEDRQRTLNMIVEVSDQGLAFRQDPAIFALALCVTDTPKNTPLPREAFLKVIRTGSHLLRFSSYVKELRGWGKGLRKLYAAWYNSKELENLIYQTVKYQNRYQWTHRDVLRKAHVTPMTDGHKSLYKWITDRDSILATDDEGNKHTNATGLALVDAFMEANYSGITEKRLITLINNFGLTHEMIPTEFKNSVKVWEALSEKMPLTAMIRNLAKMTQVGLLTPSNFDIIERIENKVTDIEYLRKSRLHPMSILIALKTYAQGHGFRGSMEWEPVQKVVDALDTGFYKAFKAVEPTKKRFCLALDVSGSMSCHTIANTNITPKEGAAAMALITANVEPKYAIYAFDTRYDPLAISPKWRLDTVVERTSHWGGGGTDCSLPMLEAHRKKEIYDVFIVYTDSETWAGHIKPCQALVRYRQEVNPDAKLIVCGMVANQFTIADPLDRGMLDICGFSADVPLVINAFAKGEI
jgi:60 kDa SS-A/Ro ribonucleoprotein